MALASDIILPVTMHTIEKKKMCTARNTKWDNRKSRDRASNVEIDG